MGNTNTSMVLMPIVFLLSSIMYYSMSANVYAASCFILSIIFAVVLVSDYLKQE